MHTGLKYRVIELARATPTQEVCGLFYATHDQTHVYPCRNIAADPTKDFQISLQDQMAAMKLGRLVGVWHSHPVEPEAFSEDDLAGAERVCLPLYLYNVTAGTWLEYVPTTYSVPLEGRPFRWGFEDCYGTARHYYRQQLGLHLRDYDRDETFEKAGSNAILDNFEKEGFVRLEPDPSQIKLHDGLLFHITTANPQHLGVFQGRQGFLHHPLEKLSRIDQLDGRWLGHLKHVLRHQSQV